MHGSWMYESPSSVTKKKSQLVKKIYGVKQIMLCRCLPVTFGNEGVCPTRLPPGASRTAAK